MNKIGQHDIRIEKIKFDDISIYYHLICNTSLMFIRHVYIL